MGAMRLVVDKRDQEMPAEIPIDRLHEALADPGNRVWLDISDPRCRGGGRSSEGEFGFHELALEDVTRPHERPRCDAYAGVLLDRRVRCRAHR
jgi:magnesium transporter